VRGYAYYNENDPKTAAWLNELIKQGLIMDGAVDTSSIVDVSPEDLREFTQCHFFAGIGGWSYALRLAGWPDERPVWTGSCPCQPFSSAGKGNGAKDDRHLWPYWNVLIAECRPPVVFGEQVEAAIRHGWLDLVFGDLEAEDYACGAVVLGAHSVRAPHIRQRVWFVAESPKSRQHGGLAPTRQRTAPLAGEFSRSRVPSGVEQPPQQAAGNLGHDNQPRSQGRGVPDRECPDQCSPWSPSDIVWCRDGKWRPVEPGTFPLAHGIPARVGRLRGYGNAIVPQVAQAFIEAYLDG
jgi:DNA (cytosine-5)-methyltransferase 1